MPRHALRPLDRVEITSPCAAEWDAMEGNDRVRFCRHCSLHVSDVSQMTPAQAFNLVLRSPGRLCLRVHRRPDGTLVTRTPAPPLYQIRRRVSRVAAGAFGAALTLCSAAAAQAQAPTTPAPAAAAAQGQSAAGAGAAPGALTVTVTDPQGAAVPHAGVSLVPVQTGAAREAFTDAAGAYRFDSLDAGVYTLRMTDPSGRYPDETQVVTVEAGAQQTSEVMLGGLQVLGGVIAVVEPSEPLVKAAYANDLAAVRTLLAGGADVNVVDKAMGISALAAALAHGNRELLVELLRAGAEVNARLAYEQTALMRIGPATTAEVVREMLLAGAKVNLRDEDGNMALMTAAAYGSTEVVELLLKAGAKVNARTKAGETPLMYAARAGATENVRALLSAGADLDRRSGDGTTALRFARDYERPETADLLVAYGARDDEPKEQAAESATAQP